MYRFILLVISLLCALGGSAVAQDAKTNAPTKWTAIEAKEHTGAEGTVVGVIVEVNKTEKVVHLNFEKPYPAESFSAVVFSGKTNGFPEFDTLKNKTVEVSGKITQYKGKPEIVLTNVSQLKILEKASSNP